MTRGVCLWGLCPGECLCPGGGSVSGRSPPYGNARVVRIHASYWNPFLLQGMQLIVSQSNWFNFLGRCSLLALALLQTENRILFAMRSLKSFIRKTMKSTLFWFMISFGLRRDIQVNQFVYHKQRYHLLGLQKFTSSCNTCAILIPLINFPHSPNIQPEIFFV